ncbi:MAG: CHAT domain-containing tetratricopeptide repeat protein [Deltaproteobacteria bacterium]
MKESAIVLEILKQERGLSMGFFEKGSLTSTIRHYSQCAVSLDEIGKLSSEATSVLNRANRPAASKADLLNELKTIGQLLWDHLLTRTVKEKLKEAPGCDLILLLDEELINIPWELIYGGGEFLCLKFSLGRLVRTKEQLNPTQYRSRGSTLKMLILANPTDDLASAYHEGLYIKNQFDRKVKEIKIDFKSTRIDTLYVKKNLRDYDIVHFAGHCEYDASDSGNAGWVLSDGRLTTRDIVALGQSLSLPSLLFSNACHSAEISSGLLQADYQEKTYSLASAFLFSGVRHYIGAIRKLEDPASFLFAREFYMQLIRGESVGECIRRSRMQLIREYGEDSVVWANYLLYGDPDFVLFRKEERPRLTKAKARIALPRRSALKISAALSAAVIGIYLYTALPSINPNTYVKFTKSQNLFKQGRNSETLAAVLSIVHNDPLFLPAYPLLSEAYLRLGDPDNALRYYFDYVLQSQKKQDKKSLASAYIGIAWIYHGIGEYSKAFEFYNKAIEISSANKDNLNTAVAFRKLAVWYIDKEEYDKALELLTKSSEINRERQHIYAHKYNLACDYFDIALLFTDKDDLDTARKFYKKSQALFERLRIKGELSDHYFNVGEICLFEKQYNRALENYLKGLGIDRMLDNKPSIASDYNMIGELHMEMGNLNEAEKSFNSALLICKQINAPLESASVCYNLGLLYKQKRQKSKARDYFRQAQEIYRKVDTPAAQQIRQDLSELNNG